ncbi:glutamate racemase MurI [Acetobacterium woodii DSM 1030]|uniref:Glutamate racemase n=2 Tax=Acetobacterium woodii TaxID=33952 RepID=H6LE86_ACEWD|nr:glutamate racemase MurI [Acetobacterium woodii DSM 1030]
MINQERSKTMDNNGSIGVIDSGIGGFTVLKALQERLPNENYIYFGDSKRMPYGERENDELILLANSIIRDLENRGVKVVVLACNTLSSLIAELTSRVPLFSVIEAGVQETINWRERGLVGLIATTATVKNRGYEKELELWTEDIKYIAQGTHTLAKVINDGKSNLKSLKNNIREAVEPILLKGIKQGVVIEELLLGCTHFPIVSVTIRQMYPELELINPANGLVRQLNKHLTEFNYFNSQEKIGTTQILTTADYDIFERMIKELELDCDSLEITELKLR